MLNINTNLSSLIVQNSLKQSSTKLNTAIERMSTGCKINHAKDNAANYSISTNMTTKIGAYQVAEDNALQGLDMVNTAESSLNKIVDNVARLRVLAVQSQNGTNGSESVDIINSEASALITEIEREYLNCEYNGIKLFESKIPVVEQGKRVVNQSSFVSGETYYIDISEDLVKLQDLVNSGVDTTGVIFELTNDIDMTGVAFRGIGTNSTNAFKGTFDGQGYIISGLEINTSESNVGLFGRVSSATIKNIGIVDCDITGASCTGGLVGLAENNTIISDSFCSGNIVGSGQVGGCIGESATSTLTNLYFKGNVTSTGELTGGVVGRGRLGGGIKNCYSEGSVKGGNYYVGGLVGANIDGCSVNKCFSNCDVIGGSNTGGLTGSGVLTLSYSTGSVNGSSSPGNIVGNNSTVANTVYTYEEMDFTESNGWKVVKGTLKLNWEKEELSSLSGQHEVMLHVASSSTSGASVGFDISFDMSMLGEVATNGLSSANTIETIDSILEMLSLKSTEYGTIQTRLFSVLDEISIQYDNLVSARSTIRDADIAEVSAEYVQKQILQQASATLMATANQSPSIALQLI